MIFLYYPNFLQLYLFFYKLNLLMLIIAAYKGKVVCSLAAIVPT